MTVNISTQARNDAGNAIVDLIDQGSSNPNGYLEIRSGTKPANPQTGVGATVLLATMIFSLPAFGNFSNGVSLANTISDDTSVDDTGVATWFRIYNRDSVAIIDGDITITGGGGDIEFDNVNFIVGGVVAITSLVATMPQ
mgnify:CR=1 FL=1|tara:strand:- start:284 stop:703 length:420 start_codon:yes stop_codon:yes gene_type:complete